MQKSKDANSTQCSQAVSHPSTDQALHCLTSVIRRELVYSMWYGRCQENKVHNRLLSSLAISCFGHFASGVQLSSHV